ncbi:MAG: Omp28-related outer membrane protein [Lentimicrobium sp.]|jgi:hypothetical protein|nr:Omp28-related outer membrane protein [Lentimicrobium sp.]
MKHFFTLLTLSLLMSAGLFAQTYVSTEPSMKNALLEEFTGIHCPNCPDGHAIAQTILDNNPGRAFTIAIHQGSYATPSTGEPDYRTIFGNAIAGQTGLAGYPAGTVNRHVFTGTATTLGRGSWIGACNTIMNQSSPVNIGINSNYDALTRTLDITVELYYTADAPTPSNFINVALIQDSIYGPQSGGGAGSNYRHMHMLRHLITGQWGEEVTTTTQGTLVTLNYTYVVPADYTGVPAVVENMKVVAFVTQDHQEVLTANEVDANGGSNLIIGSMITQEPRVKKGFMDFETNFELEVTSNLEGTTAFEFMMETSNTPDDWQVVYMIDGNEYTGTAMVDLTKNEPKMVMLKVTPGNSPGFADITLKIKSVDNPTATQRKVSVSVISGVTDLIVNGTGGDATATHQGVYEDALEASGITSFTVVDADKMVEMISADAFDDVFTCWLNIAWTVPALTDNQVEALKTFMDAGHSLFIAGQNIAWDIMSPESGSHGTTINQDFLTNYLHAVYVSGGALSTNQLKVVSGDPIFGDVPMASFATNLGYNNYADEIDAGAGANVIFNYNTTSKHAAIQYENENYRALYFAVGMEMLASTETRNQIVALSREWLSDQMVGVEYDAAINTLLSGQNYPNPASDYTYIRVTEAAKNGVIEIYNLKGQIVSSQTIDNSMLTRIDLSQLPEGVYAYRVISANNTSEARKLTVIR